jgi:hypothetical protein
MERGIVSVGNAREQPMDEWFVKYLDLETNRETVSLRVATRDEAITLAGERERDRCIIRSIGGPAGDESWAQITVSI